MSKFGNPKQIYIYVDLMQIDQPIAYRPFYFLLDYSDPGFFIEYETEGIEIGEITSGCLKNSNFRLISFGEGKDIEYIIKSNFLTTREDLSPYLPIFEASSISVSQFTESFLADNTYCIDTRMEIWPTP